MDWEKASDAYGKLIKDGNESMKVRATIELGKLSKDAPEAIIERIVPLLVNLLNLSTGGSQLLQEAAVFSLRSIAHRCDKFCICIGDGGAIPILMRLLLNSQGRFQRLVVKCLRELVICTPSNRIILARNGGLEPILNLMSSSSQYTKPYFAEILSSLTLLREVRRIIINVGGLLSLIECATIGMMVSRTRAAHALGLLGMTRRSRRLLVDLGVIPVLINLLREGDMPAKLVSGNALGIISSHLDYLRPIAQEGAIPIFAQLLEGSEHMGKEIAEDVFCILAVAEENAVAIAGHLVRILQGSNDEAKAAAADVLWDLSSYKHSISVVRASGAIPVLLELLQDGNADVREKASGAVAQLSYDEGDRGALAQAGIIPILMNLLREDSEELKDNAAEALINFSEDPLLRDMISGAFDIPSFRNIQDRLARVQSSDEHTVRSLRLMSIEQFTWDPQFACWGSFLLLSYTQDFSEKYWVIGYIFAGSYLPIFYILKSFNDVFLITS
ncbi:U-box domain-containing protein 12 isoform X2 [Amborella trichopoda]|nr:U-box domain-containing protein 12 isoform X2 [Amborella trichopoda]|eukprot:XP_011620928.2 U-box domain-containing protein 12 isoform X2 [Amborella trichopoda]